MAVHVYKDGKSELIPPLHLDSYLKSGWSVDKEPKAAPKAKAEPKPKAAPKAE